MIAVAVLLTTAAAALLAQLAARKAMPPAMAFLFGAAAAVPFIPSILAAAP